MYKSYGKMILLTIFLQLNHNSLVLLKTYLKFKLISFKIKYSSHDKN